MKKLSYAILATAVSALTQLPCYALDCAKVDPASVAVAFYATHRDFIHIGAGSPPLSNSLSKLVKANITQNLEVGDVGPIDWDFWTDAQDGEADRAAKVTSVRKDRDRMVVRLSYMFSPSPEKKSVPKETDIVLVRDPSACWLVDDVLHNGQAVSRLLNAGTSAQARKK